MGGVPRRVVFAIVLGTLLNPLNSSMIAVALVTLHLDFGIDLGTSTWLISAFYLAGAVGQPLMGRLADLLGARRVFLTGLTVALLVSIAAPFSPTFGWLVAARVVAAVPTSIRGRERGPGRSRRARGAAVRRHVDQPAGRPACSGVHAGADPARGRAAAGGAAGRPRAALRLALLRSPPARREPSADRRVHAVRGHDLRLLHVLLRPADLAGGDSRLRRPGRRPAHTPRDRPWGA